MAVVYKVESARVAGSYYKVVIREPNEAGFATVTCDCPDFRFRKHPKGEYCKHVKYVFRG